MIFLFIPDDYLCPVKVYNAFCDKRPLDCCQSDSRFYLTPIKNPKGNVWFSSQPMGKTKIGELFKTMSSVAGLTGRFTNHSIRRTSINSLLDSGVHETKVAQLTGHKNIQSINSYRTVSEQHQKEMSHILTRSLKPSAAQSKPSVSAVAPHQGPTQSASVGLVTIPAQSQTANPNPISLDAPHQGTELEDMTDDELIQSILSTESALTPIRGGGTRHGLGCVYIKK